MKYTHFYRHGADVNDIFVIWSFPNRFQKHKVRDVIDEVTFACYCAEERNNICNDANYFLEKWTESPVIAHGVAAAAPPSWRKIEIGKYVEVSDLLKVANLAVMIGGAVLLHKAGIAAHNSLAAESLEFSVQNSRPASLQELDLSNIVASDASLVEVSESGIVEPISLDVSMDSNTFRDFSVSSHSLSDVNQQLNGTFGNSVVVLPDAEAEVIACLNNTFSDSMLYQGPKEINLSGFSGEFAEPFANNFALDVNKGRVFLNNVLSNDALQPQLTAQTKDFVSGALNTIEVTGSLPKNAAMQIVSNLEKEIGTFKVYQNYVGSKHVQTTTKIAKVQEYQLLYPASAFVNVTYTTLLGPQKELAITEVKKEFLMQTSIDLSLSKLFVIQSDVDPVFKLKLVFQRINAPLIGHSCLIFSYASTVPDPGIFEKIQFVLSNGSDSYLVRGQYDNCLWVYCDRAKLEKAEIANKDIKVFSLYPQKKRQYVFWMNVDAHKDKADSNKIVASPDAIATIKQCGALWLTDASKRKQKLYGSDVTVNENSMTGVILRNMTEPLFASMFQFNGVECILQSSKLAFLPAAISLVPYTHYQVVTYDAKFRVQDCNTIAIRYDKSHANLGLLCGNDYISIDNIGVRASIDKLAEQKYKSLSFFSTFDFVPIKIKSIIFKRPWVISPSFYYMTIELDEDHKIQWSRYSTAKSEGYGPNPTFTMDLIGKDAESHLHVRHRCRLRIYSIENDRTICFTTSEPGNEKDIHPDVYKDTKLGFPIDENLSKIRLLEKEIERQNTPMQC